MLQGQRRILFNAILVLLISPAAFASLGDNESSIQNDEATINLNGQAKAGKSSSCTTTVEAKFKVRDCKGKHQLKQYITLDGSTVFAITWKGPTHGPHMNLLGRYTQEVKKAHQDYLDENGRQDKKHKTRSPFIHLVTQGNGVVYDRAGHMGDLSGRIYVPSLFPANVTEQDIQ